MQIQLTVESIDFVNLITTETSGFETTKIENLRANPNSSINGTSYFDYQEKPYEISHTYTVTETVAAIIALGASASNYRGVLNCGANPNYPAGTSNDYWKVSVAGKVGGGSGLDVEVGDEIICIIDSLGGTEAAVGSSYMVIQKNMIPTTVTVLRTGTDNSAFVTAKTIKDAGITTSTTTIMELSGGTTQQVLLTATAAQRGMTITQTAGTESALYIMSGINSTTANVVSINVYPSAALTGTEMVTGVYTDMDSNGADADGTAYSGFRTRVVSTTAGRADMVGYTAAIVGNRTTSDTDNGVLIGFGNGITPYTQNSTTSQSYGLRIAALTAANYYVQTGGQFYGIHLLATAAYTQSATCTRTGLYIGGTFDRGIDFKSVTLSAGQENAMIDIGTWTTPITVTGQTEHYAPIQVNLASNSTIAKNITAARFRVDTAVANTLTAVYGIQVRNNLLHDVASAYGCHASMNLGTMAVITGAIAVGSFYLEGTGTITPAGANPIDVVNATNVHSGTGVSNVLNVCNNTASAVGTVATLSNLSGVVTNMLYINNANASTTGVSINNTGTMTNMLLITGTSPTVFLNMDGLTASNGTLISTSGTDATTFAGRIKVITPNGSAGWINVYSTSNEA